MNIEEFIKILGGLGLGAGVAAVLTALINTRSNRGKSRAEAADLLIGAAERVGKLNADLDAELRNARARLDRIEVLVIQYLANQITRQELQEEIKGKR